MAVTKRHTRVPDPATISTNPTTASGTDTVVTGLSKTVTVRGPVKLTLNIPFVSNDNATGGTKLSIARGSTILRSMYHIPKAAGVSDSKTLIVRDNPAPGEYTYNVYWSRVTAGTSTLTGSLASEPSFWVEPL